MPSCQGVAVLEEVLAKMEAAKNKAKPEEKEKIEDIKKRDRKPPKDGPCKGCGQNKPLNRLMLCYPCWSKDFLRQRGWRDGEPHPSWCQCGGAVPGHVGLRSEGN